MSHKQISLSAGEWQIMERLWEKQPMTLMELVRALAPETGWSKSTIVTMVTRRGRGPAGDRVPAQAGVPGQRGDAGQHPGPGRRPDGR